MLFAIVGVEVLCTQRERDRDREGERIIDVMLRRSKCLRDGVIKSGAQSEVAIVVVIAVAVVT